MNQPQFINRERELGFLQELWKQKHPQFHRPLGETPRRKDGTG